MRGEGEDLGSEVLLYFLSRRDGGLLDLLLLVGLLVFLGSEGSSSAILALEGHESTEVGVGDGTGLGGLDHGSFLGLGLSLQVLFVGGDLFFLGCSRSCLAFLGGLALLLLTFGGDLLVLVGLFSFLLLFSGFRSFLLLEGLNSLLGVNLTSPVASSVTSAG